MLVTVTSLSRMFRNKREGTVCGRCGADVPVGAPLRFLSARTVDDADQAVGPVATGGDFMLCEACWPKIGSTLELDGARPRSERDRCVSVLASGRRCRQSVSRAGAPWETCSMHKPKEGGEVIAVDFTTGRRAG